MFYVRAEQALEHLVKTRPPQEPKPLIPFGSFAAGVGAMALIDAIVALYHISENQDPEQVLGKGASFLINSSLAAVMYKQHRSWTRRESWSEQPYFVHNGFTHQIRTMDKQKAQPIYPVNDVSEIEEGKWFLMNGVRIDDVQLSESNGDRIAVIDAAYNSKPVQLVAKDNKSPQHYVTAIDRNKDGAIVAHYNNNQLEMNWWVPAVNHTIYKTGGRITRLVAPLRFRT